MTAGAGGARGYTSAQTAAGYASGRPRIHPLIIDRLAATLGNQVPVSWALDVGCGAGLSTAALSAVARNRLGIDPAAQMLAHHDQVAPGAHFLVAAAEALPVGPASIDLISAAGAVNYTDTSRFLPEVRRVLRPGGVLAIYDYGHGRTSAAAPGLTHWFTQYRHRYPPEPGYDLDVRLLDYRAAGLFLRGFEEFQVTIGMDQRSYVEYALTGSGVRRQIAAGGSSPTIGDTIRNWCDTTLAPIFAGRTIDIEFPAYLAVIGAIPS
jgi:SAM-dependent methyltransferase